MKIFLLIIAMTSFYQGVSALADSSVPGSDEEYQECIDAATKNNDEKGAGACSKKREEFIKAKNEEEICKNLYGKTDEQIERCRKISAAQKEQNNDAKAKSEQATQASIAKCKEEIETAKTVIPANGTSVQDAQRYGSDKMRACVNLTKGHLRNIYRVGGARGAEKPSWLQFIKHSDFCINKVEKDCQAGKTNSPAGEAASFNVDTALEKCASDNTELKNLAIICDGAAYIVSINHRDWDKHAVTETVKSANLSPVMVCNGMGVETIDYEACVDFINNSQNLDTAQTLVQTGQELYYQDKTMTAQMEAASSTNTATASLSAMKTSVKGQEDIMTQRAAMNTAKFGFLLNKFYEIPTFDTLKEQCANYKISPDMAKELGLEPNVNGCSQAISKGFAFLQNGPTRDQMKAKLASIGINAAADGVKASLLAKRANDIDNAIANVNSFQVMDPAGIVVTDAQSTYCQANPGDPKCFTGGLNRTVDLMGDNVISFGEGGAGTVYHNTNPTLGEPTGAAGPNGSDSKDKPPVGSIGSVIPSSQQNGGVADVAAAATIGKGSDPAGGGGGGAGGGGVGGGGGGGAAPGQQVAGGASGSQGKAPRYDGGGGTLSMMGGFGINKAKSTAKDDGNPFGKLFGKDGNRSGAIDFGRNPASQKVGNKTDNIFDMISKRYTNVNDSKRLIEYEIAK